MKNINEIKNTIKEIASSVEGIGKVYDRFVYPFDLKDICNLIFVFLIAFTIRIIFWKIYGGLFSSIDGDTLEYVLTSVNLKPNNVFKLTWNYSEWYQRTPVYVLFLHIIHRKLIFQIILSSISCVLMYRMNKTAGLLWTIYLQDIIYSFNYNKESLLLFCVILFMYLFRNRRFWLVIIIPIIFSGFTSYGGVITSSISFSKGMMLNFWHLWQPSFNISVGYSKNFVYFEALPYVIAMIYFIRHIKLLSVEFIIFSFLSIMYGVLYAEPRHRELFMPLLILYIAEPLRITICNFNFRKFWEEVAVRFATIKNTLNGLTSTSI